MGAMAIALRCFAIAALGISLMPAAALGNATVDLDVTVGLITITDDASSDTITVSQTATEYVVTTPAPNQLTALTDCNGISTQEVRCARGANDSINVDMGPGVDTFSAPTVTVPIAVAGGNDNDTLRGGAGPDVLAGGAGNDDLNGLGGVDDYFGELGNDTIEATDGNAERISCGAGTDSVHNDFTDIIAECETGIDGDRDGF